MALQPYQYRARPYTLTGRISPWQQPLGSALCSPSITTYRISTRNMSPLRIDANWMEIRSPPLLKSAEAIVSMPRSRPTCFH